MFKCLNKNMNPRNSEVLKGVIEKKNFHFFKINKYMFSFAATDHFFLPWFTITASDFHIYVSFFNKVSRRKQY